MDPIHIINKKLAEAFEGLTLNSPFSIFVDGDNYMVIPVTGGIAVEPCVSNIRHWLWTNILGLEPDLRMYVYYDRNTDEYCINGRRVSFHELFGVVIGFRQDRTDESLEKLSGLFGVLIMPDGTLVMGERILPVDSFDAFLN